MQCRLLQARLRASGMFEGNAAEVGLWLSQLPVRSAASDEETRCAACPAPVPCDHVRELRVRSYSFDELCTACDQEMSDTVAMCANLEAVNFECMNERKAIRTLLVTWTNGCFCNTLNFLGCKTYGL